MRLVRAAIPSRSAVQQRAIQSTFTLFRQLPRSLHGSRNIVTTATNAKCPNEHLRATFVLRKSYPTKIPVLLKSQKRVSRWFVFIRILSSRSVPSFTISLHIYLLAEQINLLPGYIFNSNIYNLSLWFGVSKQTILNYQDGKEVR